MGLKIAVGMSGGIDSSIAAYLLHEQGNEVIGFTLKLWDDGSRCCDIKDIINAQKFCYKLGIKHYVIDLRNEFKQYIIDDFIAEYLKGRTPNPCVLCNNKIKFGQLFFKLQLFDFDYLATGHYARIVKQNNQFFLSKAKDNKKSQEYFLARIDKKLLPKIVFPLSELTKEEVKKIAATLDFDFRSDESQEICFIKPGTTYYDFIARQIKDESKYSGNIININGEILNQHAGYYKYTIGQRQGLGISDHTPYYVIRIDAKNKNVIIGKRADTYSSECSVKDIYWFEEEQLKEKMDFNIKIRYNHKGGKAHISLNKNKNIISFEEPQHAITPGQLAVFYDNNLIKGAGWIDEILN